MQSYKYWLMTGAAVIVALGVGYGAAQLLNRPAPEAAHAEEGHSEDEAEAALVALSPAQAAAAGVTVVALQRGAGPS